MAVHVHSLPDDCLLLIFDRIPQQDLLQLDFVCLRWASLLLSACARRRTFVLIFGGDRSRHEFRIPFNSRGQQNILPVAERDASLMLPQQNEPFDGFLMAQDFANLFPNVKTLVVINSQCNEEELRVVIGLLLSFWSLSTLKLWIRTRDIDQTFVDRPEHHQIGTLLIAINSQHSSLRQLTLDIDGQIVNLFNFPVAFYSFISRLKVVKLFLGCYDSDNAIWDIVHRFDRPELVQIGLGSRFPLLDSALNPEFEFATKVDHLYGLWYFELVEQLGEFCRRLSSVSSIQIYWTANITFGQLVDKLALLTKLARLKLLINFDQHPENAFALVDRVDGGDDDEDEDEPRPRMSLPQITTLELAIKKRSHDEFVSLSPLVFPSVKEIILKDEARGCSICGPYTDNNGQHNQRVLNRCKRRLMRSLKNKFTKLTAQTYLLDALQCFITFAFVMAIFIGIFIF